MLLHRHFLIQLEAIVRISQSRVIFDLGTDSLPLPQDDIRIKNSLSQYVFVRCLNGDTSLFFMYCTEEAELAVVVEVAEEFFGAGEVS